MRSFRFDALPPPFTFVLSHVVVVVAFSLSKNDEFRERKEREKERKGREGERSGKRKEREKKDVKRKEIRKEGNMMMDKSKEKHVGCFFFSVLFFLRFLLDVFHIERKFFCFSVQNVRHAVYISFLEKTFPRRLTSNHAALK